MSTPARKALGRSLTAIAGARPVPIAPLPEPAPTPDSQAGAPRRLPLRSIRPNPQQPRQYFSQESLEELAASIRSRGVIQPVVVTPDTEPGKYILLAGERRLRASEQVGLADIPALILERASEKDMLELALIENVQRENLNPVEEARAYKALGDQFGYTQDQLSAAVGKGRVAVANAIRLLRLNSAALEDLQDGRLTPGHARALLTLIHPGQQEELRREIIEKDLTVRRAEARAREIQTGSATSTKSRAKRAEKSTESPQKNVDIVAIEERMLERLGCKVRIRVRSARSGLIEIPYGSLDEFDRLLDILGIDPST